MNNLKQGDLVYHKERPNCIGIVDGIEQHYIAVTFPEPVTFNGFHAHSFQFWSIPPFELVKVPKGPLTKALYL